MLHNDEDFINLLPNEVFQSILVYVSLRELLKSKYVSHYFKINIDAYIKQSLYHPERVVQRLSSLSAGKAHEFLSEYRQVGNFSKLQKLSFNDMQPMEIFCYVLTRRAKDTIVGLADRLKLMMNTSEFRSLTLSTQENFAIMLINLQCLEAKSFEEKFTFMKRLRELISKRKNSKFINLSGAIMLNNFVLTSTEKSKLLEGADLSHANLSGSKLIKLDLTSCNLHSTTFKDARIWFVNFSGTDLASSDLSGTTIHHSIFNSADLTDSNLAVSNLEGSDFSDSTLIRANFTHSVISNTNFINTDMTASNLNDAHLSNVNVRNIKLCGVDLSNCTINLLDNNGQENLLEGVRLLALSSYQDVIEEKDLINKLDAELTNIHVFIKKHSLENSLRKVLVNEIKSIINFFDLDKQLRLIDAIIELNHPIFHHQNNVSKKVNVAMQKTKSLFFSPKEKTTPAFLTNSQKSFVHFRKEIQEKIAARNNEIDTNNIVTSFTMM